MSKTLVIVASTVAYLVLTYVSLRRAASPLEPCDYDADDTSSSIPWGRGWNATGQGNSSNDDSRGSGKSGTTTTTTRRCFRPMLRGDEALELDLWTMVDPKEKDGDGGGGEGACSVSEDGPSQGTCSQSDEARRSASASARWGVVETCRSIPINVSSPEWTVQSSFVNDVDCTIRLPSMSRMRGGRGSHPRGGGGGKPLRAKFVLRRAGDGNDGDDDDVVIAEAPFTLTRMVERKVSREYTGGNPRSHGAYELVPHFKYMSQRIVLRLVEDRRGYGTSPLRGDGTVLAQHRGPCGRGSGGMTCHMYRPIFYVDDTSLRHSSQVELAPTGEGKPPVKLRVKVSLISPVRDVVIGQVAEGMRLAESMLHETELDEIRWFISDENLYRFALTQVISTIHVALDFMAFRDEIGFFVGRTDMGGLSVSSVTSHFVCSLVIFLYLCDSGRTSYLVLGSVFLGVLTDGWKAWKVLRPSWSSSFPFFVLRDPSSLSRTELQSKGYDRIARLHLGLVLYPLIVGSALYARGHYSYRSWWSWFISNAANAVYTFGFISLCPQLYINYRLKSVAHLPWKVFVYKLFNTFIDDVFAYLIEMPLKHKLMTLRDDVVFVMFLVQAYMYRVDKTRPNEYGYAYEEAPAAIAATAEGESEGPPPRDTLSPRNGAGDADLIGEKAGTTTDD